MVDRCQMISSECLGRRSGGVVNVVGSCCESKPSATVETKQVIWKGSNLKTAEISFLLCPWHTVSRVRHSSNPL